MFTLAYYLTESRLNPQCQFQVVNSKNKMQQPLQPAYSLPLLTIYLTFYI